MNTKISTTRQRAFDAINSERDYQDKVWEGTGSDNKLGDGALDRTIDEYALYIQGYADELTKIASHSANSTDKLNIVRKIGALAVACMERHGAVLRNVEDAKHRDVNKA